MLSSFGAMRMEQCSHQTLKSQFLTAALPIFTNSFLFHSALFHSAYVVAFENVRPWLCCSRPGACIPGARRLATAFWPLRVAPLPRCDRERIRSAFHTCGSTRPGTTWHQLWTTGEYASELQ